MEKKAIKVAYINFSGDKDDFDFLYRFFKKYNLELEFLKELSDIRDLNTEKYPIAIISPKKEFALLMEEFDSIKNYLINGGKIILLAGMGIKHIFSDSLKMLFELFQIFPRIIDTKDFKKINIKFISDEIPIDGFDKIEITDPLTFITDPKNEIIGVIETENFRAPIILIGNLGSGKFVIIGSQKVFYDEDKKDISTTFLINTCLWLLGLIEKRKKISENVGELESKAKEKTLEEKENSENSNSSVNKLSLMSLDNELKNILKSVGEEIKNIKNDLKEIKKIESYFSELLSKMDKLIDSHQTLINNLATLRKEVSNLEIDLLEALRDDMNAISNLLVQINNMENSLKKKIDELLKSLNKKTK